MDANLHLGFGADERNYEVGSSILKALNISKVKLLTNNPLKTEGLENNGIEVCEHCEIIITPSIHNEFYLKTKQFRMGHALEFVQ